MAGAAGCFLDQADRRQSRSRVVISFAAGSLVLRAGGRTRVDARWPRSSGAFLLPANGLRGSWGWRPGAPLPRAPADYKSIQI